MKKLKNTTEEENKLITYNENSPSYFESGLHALWLADINNDGNIDYIWTTEAAGSGHYDSFDSYTQKNSEKLKKLLFPLDGSQIPSNFCQPPFKFKNEKTIICFSEYYSVNSKGKRVGSGSMSNIANRAVKLIEIQSEYLWEKTKGKFIGKKKIESKL